MAAGSSQFQDGLVVLQNLRAGGFEAYFAGGCVRDVLLGKQPDDYDVATNAPPGEVRKLFKNTQAVGAAFGVILVRQGSSTVEVATFRTDLDYQDGRRPSGVKFTTAVEDARRRDFTINGLFLDPVENRIIDHVGGQADLQNKVLRAIGRADERFAEDHLRMLRAVRFASRLGFEIEAMTQSAIKAHAGELIRISPERIAEELRKMLSPGTRNRAVSLLESLGLMPVILRFLPESRPVSAVSRAVVLIDADAPVSFGLALAAIVLDFRMSTASVQDVRTWLGPSEIKRSAQAMRQALKISNDEAAEMVGALSWGHLLEESKPTVARLKRFLQQPFSGEARKLMHCVERCKVVDAACVERIGWLLAELHELSKGDFAPVPLITGDDLTAAGATPGPKFKSALDAAYDAQLEGKITTREQAMEVARRGL